MQNDSFTKFFYSLAFLALLFPTYTNAQAGNALIRGHSSKPVPYILLNQSSSLPGFENHIDTITVNAQGNFNRRIVVKQEQRAALDLGNTRFMVWLRPGARLTLELSDTAKKIETDAVGYANYYLANRAEQIRLFKLARQYHPGYDDEGTTLTDDEYFAITDSITQAQLAFVTSYFANSKLPGKDVFIRREKNTIIANNLYYKTQFEKWDYKRFGFLQDKLSWSGNSTYKYSDSINMNDRNLLDILEYREFVSRMLPEIARMRIAEQGKTFSLVLWFKEQMAIIDTLCKDPYCNMANKAFALNMFTDQMKMHRQMFWAGPLDTVLSLQEPNDKYHLLAYTRNNYYAAVRETKFKKGAPAPAFVVTDTSGKMYRLEDFKGKKIYLDMWATWCVHCIELTPDWDKLADEYAGNDSVVFLSLSFDDKAATWLNYVRKRPARGLALHAGDGGWESIFAKAYDIRYLPHFMLIDEEGKIIEYDAPKPDKPGEVKALLINE